MSNTNVQESGPNSLSPVNSVNVRTMSKWPLLLVMLAGGLLLGVLVWSVNFAHKQDDEEESKQVQINESEKPLIMGEGQGLALKPPNVAVVPAPPPPPPAASDEPLVIVTRDKNLNPYGEELESLRLRKQQAFLDALHSPLSVKKASERCPART